MLAQMECGNQMVVGGYLWVSLVSLRAFAVAFPRHSSAALACARALRVFHHGGSSHHHGGSPYLTGFGVRQESAHVSHKEEDVLTSW